MSSTLFPFQPCKKTILFSIVLELFDPIFDLQIGNALELSKALKGVDKTRFMSYNINMQTDYVCDGCPCRAKMGAIKDGSPTRINKWER